MNRQTVSPAAIEQREVTILLKGHLLNVHTITAVGPRREKAVVRSGFNVKDRCDYLSGQECGRRSQAAKQHFDGLCTHSVYAKPSVFI